MSIRAKILRHSLSWFIVGPAASLEDQRRGLARFGSFQVTRSAHCEETSLGGIPALRATPKDGFVDRHILYLHGGGYALGSPKTHIGLAAQLAVRCEASVTVVDYRLAPEHPYPAAIKDCVMAYRALVSSVDSDSVVVAGDSAGGGASLSTVIELRDADDPLPGCLYLLSPWTDLTGSGESITDKADIDPMLDPQGIEQMAIWYRGDYEPAHPGVSPLFADLTGLPPMLVQLGSDEVLLSDSTRLVDRAKAAGVEAELDVTDGMWHVYQVLAPVLPEARTALHRAATFINARTLSSTRTNPVSYTHLTLPPNREV